MGQTIICNAFFSLDQLYETLNDETLLKILLYLRDNNPKVHLKHLADYFDMSESDISRLLSGLIVRGFVTVPTEGTYNLDSRARKALDVLLGK